MWDTHIKQIHTVRKVITKYEKWYQRVCYGDLISAGVSGKVPLSKWYLS